MTWILARSVQGFAIGAGRVEPPIRKPPRKNQSYDGRLTGPTPSDSARRDLSISAIKKKSTIFDLTTAPAPYEKYPQLCRKATRWRQQCHPAASTIALGPPQAPKFLALKRCLHRSKALGQEMLESAGLDRTAAATVVCSTWRERRENRTTGGRVSTAGGSKSRADEAAGGQQTHATDGKKDVDELGRGWQGRRSPPELPLAIKCRCAHEKEVVVSAAGVDDLPMHMNGRDWVLSKGLSRQARMG